MSDYTCDLSGTESFVKKDGHKMFTTDIVKDLNYWKQKAEKLQAENEELKGLIKAIIKWMDSKGCPVPYDLRFAFETPPEGE